MAATSTVVNALSATREFDVKLMSMSVPATLAIMPTLFAQHQPLVCTNALARTVYLVPTVIRNQMPVSLVHVKMEACVYHSLTTRSRVSVWKASQAPSVRVS